MTVLVLGEVCEKMVEADGFGAKINFGLAKVRNNLKLVIDGNNFTRSTDNANHRRIPNEHRAVIADRGRQAPTADKGTGHQPPGHSGRSGRGSDDVRDVVFNYHLNPDILRRHNIGLCNE